MSIAWKDFYGVSVALKNEIISDIEIGINKILETLEITQSNNAYITSEVSNLQKSLQELNDLISKGNEQLLIIGIIGIVTTVVIGTAILTNQRKIRKELRQLREMLEKKEDKPDGKEDISSN